MSNKRTRESLSRLLQERNEHPERAAEVDARIFADFGRTLAVLVMDMTGFSRQTIRYGIPHFLAKIHRMHSVAIPAVKKEEGRVVKVEADNVYAVFPDVERAVAAALRIDEGLEAANSMLPEELDMHGEFGIGYGQVLMVGDEDLYGSEVNLASKLGEDLAERGEILLTESAYKQVEGGPRRFEPLEMSISGLELLVYKVRKAQR